MTANTPATLWSRRIVIPTRFFLGSNYSPSCPTLPTLAPAAAKRKSITAASFMTSTAENVYASSFEERLQRFHPDSALTEKHGIVLRDYYPPQISNTRANAYFDGDLLRPIEMVANTQRRTEEIRKMVVPGAAVAHWFKTDLRCHDNTALALAELKAKQMSVPLICFYLVSPQDFEAHLCSPVRVDFILRSLEVLQADLAKQNIPLYMETVEKRGRVPARVLELLESWGCNHLFANLEYEVDELRREAKLIQLLADKEKSFDVVHDTCIVPPGDIRSAAGNEYALYEPFYGTWVSHINENPHMLDPHRRPSRFSATAIQKFPALFDCAVPPAPESKRLTDEERERFGALWPCGESEAKARLRNFCKERITEYADKKDFSSVAGTSGLSPYLASGTISARNCLRLARNRNSFKKLDAGIKGIVFWIRELAWRDFNRHILVRWPHICMNKPFRVHFSDFKWSYDEADFAAWCEGRTGYPIIDAGMRQLKQTGFMHNRIRMLTASFLVRDLLIDYRLGEKYFMEHLVDGDFANNNGGWGFTGGVGVVILPQHVILHPRLQSERHDPNGEYIRTWVPELAGIDTKYIHDPYCCNWGGGDNNTGDKDVSDKDAKVAADEAARNGYPKCIIVHAEAKRRTAEMLRRFQWSKGRETTHVN